MHCDNAIVIDGSAERIFELAADIANWPQILPHYRYVVIEEESGNVRVATMGARRGWFPVRWRARQELVPEERRVLFRHVGGVTKGMDVEWRLEPAAQFVRVTISHELAYPIPILGPFFAEYIVGRMFVQSIAGKTLKCIKKIVEAEAASEATDGSS